MTLLKVPSPLLRYRRSVRVSPPTPDEFAT
jgi:hypothetical protein